MKTAAALVLDIPVIEPTRNFPLLRQIKRGICSVMENHWSFSVVRNYYSGLGSCLLYHRIGPKKFRPDEFSPYTGLTVTADSFDEQCRYIKNNFCCLSLPAAVELLKQGALPRRSAIITFDDGYKDNLEIALPILEKYELPATIYVVSGLIDRKAELWWFEQEFIIKNNSSIDFEWEGHSYHWLLRTLQQKYVAIQSLNRLFKALPLSKQRRFMAMLRAQCTRTYSYDRDILTWPEVRQLDHHPLITIGAHTTNHAVLSRLQHRELLLELSDSKERLEEELGHPVAHFAYPFGGAAEVGQREFTEARACGFISAVTARYGHIHYEHNHHLFTIPRVPVNYDDSLASLSWKLSGIHLMVQHRGRRVVEC